MATPIIAAIKEKYPDSTIRVHTDTQYLDIFSDNPAIQDIITKDHNTYMDTYEWIESHGGSDHICPLAMANHYDTLWHHNEETCHQHMIDWYVTRTGLGIKVKDYNVKVYGSYRPRSAELSPMPLSYILIHTTSLLESKNWPLQYFNHLVQLLKKDVSNLADIYVQIGGGSDKPLDSVEINLCGKTNIKETTWLIEHAKYYIGIDSGSAYIAGASGIPTFLMMGATSGMAEGYTGPSVGPIGPNIHYIEPNRPDNPNCKPIPCINHCVLGKPCINLVMPKDVYSYITKTLEEVS